MSAVHALQRHDALLVRILPGCVQHIMGTSPQWQQPTFFIRVYMDCCSLPGLMEWLLDTIIARSLQLVDCATGSKVQ